METNSNVEMYAIYHFRNVSPFLLHLNEISEISGKWHKTLPMILRCKLQIQWWKWQTPAQKRNTETLNDILIYQNMQNNCTKFAYRLKGNVQNVQFI
jgi:hypothetical protein